MQNNDTPTDGKDSDQTESESALRGEACCASCECLNWERLYDGIHDKGTNHHPNCPRVDDSLIDVWRVEYDGAHYYTTTEPDHADMHPEEVVTKQRMHKELFDRMPDFNGF